MTIDLAWIAVALGGAIAVHIAVVRAFPYLVMFVVGRVFKGPVNEMIHMPPTTAASRSVVRPSPDLLYSAVIYDVRDGPLRIDALVPATYWSISFFANNTDNYFVTNDRAIGEGPASFVLAGPGEKPDAPDSAYLIEAKSKRGVILLRALVQDFAKIDDLIAIQKQAHCSRL